MTHGDMLSVQDETSPKGERESARAAYLLQLDPIMVKSRRQLSAGLHPQSEWKTGEGEGGWRLVTGRGVEDW